MRLGRLLRRFGTGLDPLAPERAAPQDDRSVADFSRLYFGRSVLENWIAPWIAELAFGDVQETSRVLALLLLARRRFAIPGTLRGDLSRVAEACAAKLPARLGVPVTAIEPGPGAGFLVHHRGGDGEATTEAEAIVLALPAPDALQVARAVLSPAEAEVLGATRYQAALSLAVGLDAPLFPAPTRVRIPPGQSWPLVSLTAEPGVAGGRVPEGQGLAILVSPASPCQLEASDEATSTRLLPYLDRIWPAAGARVGWTRLHRHGLGLPLFGVGRYRALAQLQRVETGLFQEGRRIALAGDYRVAPTLEGAVVSGMRAAAMIEPIRDSAFAPGPRASGRG